MILQWIETYQVLFIGFLVATVLVIAIVFAFLSRSPFRTRRKFNEAFYVSILIVGVLLGVLVGYYAKVPIQEFPNVPKYAILKDTLIIVLAVIAAAVTAFGFLVYRVMSERLMSVASEQIRNEARRSLARVATHIGFAFWKLITPSDVDTRKFQERILDEAIRLTEVARDNYASKLDERDPENQELIAAIRNNLASYYAQRHWEKDKDVARGYAQYLHAISNNFPERRGTWEATVKEVDAAFPDP